MGRLGYLMVAALLFFGAVGLPVVAQVTTESVQFKAGETGATLENSVKGDQSVDYTLLAKEGQSMVVTLETDNASNYFNIIAPGSDSAMFIGSSSGNRFEGTVPSTGTYRVQVYLMRNAARRDEVANYRLDIGISGGGASADQPAGDFADAVAGGPDYWEVAGVSGGDFLNLRAEPSTKAAVLMKFANGTVLSNRGCEMVGDMRWCAVARPEDPSVSGWVAGQYLREASGPQSAATTDALTAGGYNAEGSVKCSVGNDSFDAECAFGVMRSGNRAVFTLTRPDTGARRALTFSSADQVFATDDGAELAWQRQSDNWWVSANGTEFYLIPDAAIFGG
jgi:uncharacterized protein YraI